MVNNYYKIYNENSGSLELCHYGSSKRPCIIIIFLSCFVVITT